MKNFVKYALVFILGIGLTTVTFLFIIPVLNPEPTDLPPPVESLADTLKAVGDETTESTVIPTEPAETESIPVAVMPTQESTTTPETTSASVPTSTPAPTQETTSEPIPTSAPEPTTMPEPVQTTPAPQTVSEPETYYDEDGRKYTYFNGIKLYLADEDEPNAVQEDFYDWENDPNKNDKGPFGGSGGNE